LIKDVSWLGTLLVSVVACALGLFIAAIDLAAPFGDDSAQFTVLLWIASGGCLGFAAPHRAWRWAVLVGPWVAFMYVALHFVRPLALAKPFSYAYLFLIPVGVGVCMVGAYSGVLARRISLPPSPSVHTPV